MMLGSLPIASPTSCLQYFVKSTLDTDWVEHADAVKARNPTTTAFETLLIMCLIRAVRLSPREHNIDETAIEVITH
jgi:hypothetical protein